MSYHVAAALDAASPQHHIHKEVKLIITSLEEGNTESDGSMAIRCLAVKELSCPTVVSGWLC